MSHAVYRCFDIGGRLLYVGRSGNPIGRLETHRRLSRWFRSVSQIGLEWFASQAEASWAEREAIRIENPEHNRARPIIVTTDHAEPFTAGLLLEIRNYCDARQINPTTFGRLAVNDGKFVSRLERGGQCLPRTAAKLRAFIQGSAA